MKSIIARTGLLGLGCYLLLGAMITNGHAGEYYMYRDSNGGLVISNKQPPPGSKIIKQQTLPDTAEGETVPVQEGVMRPNENANPSKPSNKE